MPEMKKKMEDREDAEEVVIAGEGDDTAQKKVKKLKDDLKQCERERKEYLDGWKRAKADALNEKKRQAEFLERERAGAVGRCVAAVLPVLDAVSVAVSQEGGDMREGVERNSRAVSEEYRGGRRGDYQSRCR